MRAPAVWAVDGFLAAPAGSVGALVAVALLMGALRASGCGVRGGPCIRGRPPVARSAPCVFLLGLAASLAVGCAKPAGAPCLITGDGFHARHGCATQCLSRWRVNCPDGGYVLPAVCAGRKGCELGSCPNGQVCYHFDDPFESLTYCIPDDVCGELSSAEVRARWERDAAEEAAAKRAAFDAKRPAGRRGTTSPTL